MENTLGTWGGKNILGILIENTYHILLEVAGFEHPTSLTRDTGHEP